MINKKIVKNILTKKIEHNIFKQKKQKHREKIYQHMPKKQHDKYNIIEKQNILKNKKKNIPKIILFFYFIIISHPLL